MEIAYALVHLCPKKQLQPSIELTLDELRWIVEGIARIRSYCFFKDGNLDYDLGWLDSVTVVLEHRSLLKASLLKNLVVRVVS